MNKTSALRLKAIVAAIGALTGTATHAITFEFEGVRGNLNARAPAAAPGCRSRLAREARCPPCRGT